MYDVFATTKFKKDLKIAIKRGYNTALMDAVVTTIAEVSRWPKNIKTIR
jgi:mRNA-degrading endonuclease YafQ of YafQ-DinJ toxin-antitoxin module